MPLRDVASPDPMVAADDAMQLTLHSSCNGYCFQESAQFSKTQVQERQNLLSARVCQYGRSQKEQQQCSGGGGGQNFKQERRIRGQYILQVRVMIAQATISACPTSHISIHSQFFPTILCTIGQYRGNCPKCLQLVYSIVGRVQSFTRRDPSLLLRSRSQSSRLRRCNDQKRTL